MDGWVGGWIYTGWDMNIQTGRQGDVCVPDGPGGAAGDHVVVGDAVHHGAVPPGETGDVTMGW